MCIIHTYIYIYNEDPEREEEGKPGDSLAFSPLLPRMGRAWWFGVRGILGTREKWKNSATLGREVRQSLGAKGKEEKGGSTGQGVMGRRGVL